MVSDPKLERSTRSGFVYRYREQIGNDKPSILLLHGLGGDENSMWVLEHILPEGWVKIAPRANYPMAEDRYSWVKPSLKGWPAAQDFNPAITALKNLVDELEAEAGFTREEMFFLGFSQGAALAFASAVEPQLRPKAIIAAAGFLPKGNYIDLKGLSVFWGHGSRDERIPY